MMKPRSGEREGMAMTGYNASGRTVTAASAFSVSTPSVGLRAWNLGSPVGDNSHVATAGDRLRHADMGVAKKMKIGKRSGLAVDDGRALPS
ncbi:MAG: hypothetical protein ACK4K8_15335 [Pannonibacter sp.]